MTDDPQPTPRRLLRSRDDRMIAGVAGGLGRHFSADPALFRIGFAVSAFFGGLGVALYLAAVLFVPGEGPDGEPVPVRRGVAAAAGVALAIAGLILLSGGPWSGAFWLDPFSLLWLVILAGAAAFAWRHVERRRARGEAGGDLGDLLRRVAVVLALTALLSVLAVAAAWATAVGGGTVVAGVIVAIGAAMALSSLTGGAAWLALPALALAIPTGLVAAAGVELEGGVGEEFHRPTTVAELREDYALAAGRLELDLRDVPFPPGRTRVTADVGMGQLDVLVPEDVCVISSTDVGLGSLVTFGSESGGIDVQRRGGASPRPGIPQIVLDTDVGVGQLRVSDDPQAIDDVGRRGPFGHRRDGDAGGRDPDPCLEER